jgi:hypothetical protein
MARVRARHRARRIPFLVVLLVAGLLAHGAPAHACSCGSPDLATWLPEADGAFVGRWVDRAEIGDGMAAVTFEVERVLKGSFGPTAIVRTNAQGSACGLERLGGSRTGLLLELGEGDGVWTSGLCSMVPPAQLLAVGGDRPPDPEVAAVSAGWSLGAKGLMAAVPAAALALLALAWVVRRRASRPGETGVA